MFLLYNFLLTISAPFWVIWMVFRTYQRKERPIWGERFGNYPFTFRKDRQRIWIHAVSVGEVVACMPVLRELKSVLPDYDIILSVTTSSGHTTAQEQAGGLYDYLVYFPIDIPRFMLAAMQRVQPAVVATIDTELWWNFLWAAKSFRATTMLVNGRISDRSFPRAMKLGFFYQALLKDVDECLMQTQTDADRIQAMGAKSVRVLGNVKFDQAVHGLDADPEEWKRELKVPEGHTVIVVGSTRGEEEESLVLEALGLVGFAKLSIVHAPRHLERVPELATLVKKATGGVAFRTKGESGQYLILDSYGELSNVYSIADIVIVGGGFEPLGGQNIIQPLAYGKPVIHGPHMQNFRDVASAAASAGATRVASTAKELAQVLGELIQNPSEAARIGEAARKFVSENLGASRRYAAAIAEAAERSAARPQGVERVKG